MVILYTIILKNTNMYAVDMGRVDDKFKKYGGKSEHLKQLMAMMKFFLFKRGNCTTSLECKSNLMVFESSA